MLNLPLQDLLGWFSGVCRVNTDVQACWTDVKDTSGQLTRMHMRKHTHRSGFEIDAFSVGGISACLFNYIYKIKMPKQPILSSSFIYLL